MRSIFLQSEALRAKDLLLLEDGLVLNLLRITSGLKDEKPVASKALRIVVSLKEICQAQ
jgi:hypothetical protein